MDDELDLTLARGGLEPGARSSIPGSWVVPADITLDEEEGLLCWRMNTATLRRVEPTPGLLHHFLRLRKSRADNRYILDFAQAWGPLHLCATHQLPLMHQRLEIDDLVRDTKPRRCRPIQRADGYFAEPLTAWRRLARDAFRIVEVGSRGRRGTWPSTPRDARVASLVETLANMSQEELTAVLADARRRQLWEEVSPGRWERLAGHSGPVVTSAEEPPYAGPSPDDPAVDDFATALISQPDALALSVGRWIDHGGGLHFQPVWDAGPNAIPDSQVGVRSLYAAIGLGLWNTIRGVAGIQLCANCNRPFEIRNKTQKYCSRRACQAARKRENQRQSRDDRAKASKS